MSQVTYEPHGDVALIRMDDGKANALSPSMIADVQEALARAAGEAKAIVLTGREGRFSAGFDLKVMMSGPDAAKALLRAGAELYLTLYEHPLPIVAACTGHAIAGGALLLGTADVRIGAHGAFKVGLNEVAIGMPLPIFAHAFARDRLDPRSLMRATLGATLYTPADAVPVGWLDRVVAPEALLEEALSEATALAALSGAPFALSKKSLRRGTVEHVRATLEEDLTEIAARMGLV